MKKVVKHIYQIYSGIQVYRNSIVKFNWASDSRDDVMSLVSDTSGTFDKNGIRYVYGYKFNEHSNKASQKIVRDYLKRKQGRDVLYSEDISEFVERAVLRLDERYSLDTFKVTVHIQSSTRPSLVDVLSEWLWEYMNNTDIDFELIKEMYEHVEFDADKATDALRSSGMSERRIERTIKYTVRKFVELKESGELFQMKLFIPKEIRVGFFNFLKFKTEDEMLAYKSLQGVNVLIFDDFMTSGSTVREVIRYLKAINDKNTLTVFVLVKLNDPPKMVHRSTKDKKI